MVDSDREGVLTIKVLERVLRILQDAYWSLTLIEGEQLNATTRANLREIRVHANAIVNLVDEILSKSNEMIEKDR